MKQSLIWNSKQPLEQLELEQQEQVHLVFLELSLQSCLDQPKSALDLALFQRKT